VFLAFPVLMTSLKASSCLWVVSPDLAGNYSAAVAAAARMVQPRNTTATFRYSFECNMSETTSSYFMGSEKPI